MTFTNPLEATLDLPTIQMRITEAEELGAELTKLEAKNHAGTDFTLATFEEKIPNNGPFSVVLPKAKLAPPGKPPVFEGEAFVGSVKCPSWFIGDPAVAVVLRTHAVRSQRRATRIARTMHGEDVVHCHRPERGRARQGANVQTSGWQVFQGREQVMSGGVFLP